MTCGHVHDDAAYVLGALAPGERLSFEEHLEGCGACGQRVRDLAGLTGLLARVPPEVLDPPEQPPLPRTVLPALVGEVRRQHRRRRWLAVGTAAAAAALVATAGTLLLTGTGDEPTAAPGPGEPPAATASPSDVQSGSPARSMRKVSDTAMTAEVAMTSVPWGTRLDLTCSYPAAGYQRGPRTGEQPAGPAYSLVVRTRDGRSHPVASWHGLPGRTMELSGATALRAGEIARVEVRGADGSRLLALSR